LPEVLDELGIDALQAPGGPLLDQLGVLAVEGSAASAGQGAVENVADDPARKGQPVAAGLPLLFEDSFPDEAIDVVVEVLRSLRQRRQIARVEGLSEHRGDRQQVAELL